MLPTDGSQPRRSGGQRKLTDAHLIVLRALALENPLASLDSLGEMLARQTGVKVCKRTLTGCLRRIGIRKRKTQRPRMTFAAATNPDGVPGYPGAFTDHEWDLVADLFVVRAGGFKRIYPMRKLVEACRFVVITGGTWVSLPKELPPWQAAYKHFRRWLAQGKFDKMNERLKSLWMPRVMVWTESEAGIV